MTPMFSSYVVVPDPPPEPASTVATPSPKNARPISRSRSRPVTAATALTCPAFSATSTTTTGATSTAARQVKVGACRSGSPTHAASASARVACGSRPPVSAATTQPAATPSSTDSRPRKPRNATVASRTAARVTTAMTGCAFTPPLPSPPSQATGARFRPISATIAPVTTGGMRASIQRAPAQCTTSPTTASRAPATTIPPSAGPMSPPAFAASTGAMKANDEPRYDGTRLRVSSRNSSVPRPETNSVVAGGNPVMSGTVNVAPNIATTCCAPMPTVRGQDRRSCGWTTSPGRIVRPSPCSVQPRRRGDVLRELCTATAPLAPPRPRCP